MTCHQFQRLVESLPDRRRRARAVAAYAAIPALRRPIYLGWLHAVSPIGWTVSHLLLAAMYYLLIYAIGLVL